jgi:hypothetical protein
MAYATAADVAALLAKELDAAETALVERRCCPQGGYPLPPAPDRVVMRVRNRLRLKTSNADRSTSGYS